MGYKAQDSIDTADNYYIVTSEDYINLEGKSMSYRIVHTDIKGKDLHEYRNISSIADIQQTIWHLESMDRLVKNVIDEYGDWEDIKGEFILKQYTKRSKNKMNYRYDYLGNVVPDFGYRFVGYDWMGLPVVVKD